MTMETDARTPTDALKKDAIGPFSLVTGAAFDPSDPSFGFEIIVTLEGTDVYQRRYNSYQRAFDDHDLIKDHLIAYLNGSGDGRPVDMYLDEKMQKQTTAPRKGSPMKLENPSVIESINRIARLSKDVGPKIWTIPGEAINSKILQEPLSDTARFTAQACISLWNGSASVNLQDLFKLDQFNFKEFIEALGSIRPRATSIFDIRESDTLPPGTATLGDVVIRNFKDQD